MATTETKKKIDESAFLIVRDKTNDNVQLIACPSNFQVGLTSTPADLTLNGKFSISEKAYSINQSNKWTVAIDDHITAALISTTYSSTSTPSSGYVSVILPKNARDGQIVIIKDFSGTSTTLPIRIYSAGGEKIDGSDYSTISTNYSVTQFIRYEKKWVTTNNTNPAGAPTNASYVVLSTDSTLTSERVLTAGPGVSIVDGGPGGSLTISAAGGGSGDVLGPASATDNAVVRFDLTTGKLIQNSGVIISDSNNVTVPGDIAVNGGDLTTTASTFNLINTTATTLNIGADATTALNIGASTGTVAVAGSLTVGGGYGSSGVSISSIGNIQANGTLTVDSTSNLNGNVTCSGDLAVNGTPSADITTTTAAATLFNTSATTLDIGGAATTIEIGAATGTTTVNNRLHATGGTSLLLDAELGNAAVGSHPAFESTFPTVYALFGHKDLNHAVDGNYALVQSNAGDTFVGASSARDIFFKNGTDGIGQLSNDAVSFTGKTGTSTTTTLGNTASASSTTIDAGTGNINIGISNSARTINIGSDPTGTATTQQTVNIGAKNTSTFNMIHIADEDSGNGHEVYIISDRGTQTSGTSVVDIGTVEASTDVTIGNSTTGTKTVVIGSITGTSSTSIYGGSNDINLSVSAGSSINIAPGVANQVVEIGNNTTATEVNITAGNEFAGVGGVNVTAPMTTRGEVVIGSAQVGSLPLFGYPRTVAFFGNNNLSHAINSTTVENMGNYAVAQLDTGETYINSRFDKGIYFSSSGSTNFLGRVYFDSGTATSKILFQGASLFNADVTIGSSYGGSSTSIYAGSNDISLDSGRDIILDATSNSSTYFKQDGNTLGYVGFLGLGNVTTIGLQGRSGYPANVAVGNATTTSTTSIYAGSGGLTLSGSNQTTVITGSSSTSADVHIGDVEIGSLPGFVGQYGMFGHKDLNHALGNYAIVQKNDGETWISAPDSKYVRFTTQGNTSYDGYIGYSSLFGASTVSLTGRTGTKTLATLGNTAADSSTTIDSGTGNINIGTSDSSRTTNIATAATTNQFINIGNNKGSSYTNIYGGGFGVYMSASFILMSASYPSQNLGADATIGAAEIGSLPGTSNQYAMFGHQALDHALGNYAVVQKNDGETWLSAADNKYVRFTTQGNASYDGYIGYSSFFGASTVSLTGRSGTKTITTLGNTAADSSTKVDAGTGNIDIGTSDSNRTINVGTAATTTQTINIGNNKSLSSTSIYGGLFGVLMSGSFIILTGSHPANNLGADVTIGAAEIGSLPGFANQYAMFGHQALDHTLGNYAIVQKNDGETWLSAVDNKYVRFTTQGNPSYDGYIGYSSFFNQSTISLTGRTGTKTVATLGNTASGSSTTIDAGTGNINIGTSDSSRTTNIATAATTNQFVNIGNTQGFSYTNIYGGNFGVYMSASFIMMSASYPRQNLGADATIGAVEVGSLPGFANRYAMFGHQALDHTLGNYAIVQENDGNTYLNAPENKYIYFTSAGSPVYNGYIGYSTLFGTLINLQGRSGQRTAVTIGSATTTSATSIYAGSGGITLSGSNQTTVITGSSSTSADAHIGDAEVGSLPGFAGQYAMFGHKDLNHAFGNYAIAQQNDGTTYLNAPENDYVYFTSAGNVSHNGYIGYSTLFGTLINLQGRSGQRTAVTIGSSTTTSATSIYAGSGGITLSGSGGQTVITGSSTTYTDALIGAWEIGSLPATQGAFPNAYAFVGHKDLNHGADGNYALVQSNVGDTFLGAVSGKDIYFKNGTDIIGQLDNSVVSLTGKTGTATTTTIGNTAGASSTTINAGTGRINLTGHSLINMTALVATYPSATATEFPLLLKTTEAGNTYRWAIGADFGYDLNFSYSLNSTSVTSRGYLSNASDVGAIDFTGQHRNYPAAGDVLDFTDKVGLIVVSNGQYKSLTSGSTSISVNEALPLVELSTERCQKSVFGVVSDHEDPNESSREYVVGNWGSVYEKLPNDNRLIINSLGEGGIWVCNINGSLQNGDYITTCEIPGYGMKQDDDLLHNYTVAKITCDCDFDLNSSTYRCEEFQHEGEIYRRAFVGCTYHCG